MDIALQHAELIADIDACKLDGGQVALWFLGQHSFIVKAGAAVIYIDPFLQPMSARRVPTLLDPAEIVHADIIAGTHDHIDHIDRPVWPALAAASPQAKFVVPEAVRPALVSELGIDADRFVGLDDGQIAEIADVRITAIPAAHEFLDRDPHTGRYPYLGYVFEGNGRTIYHAGDTCLYEGMYKRLRRFGFDVMLLPINGRDAERLKRNCIGNMTFQEAVDLAGAQRPRFAVPTHYDMFAGNTADPQAFVDYAAVKYPDLKTKVCGYGERWVVGGE